MHSVNLLQESRHVYAKRDSQGDAETEMAQNQTTGEKDVPLAPLNSLFECYRLVYRVAADKVVRLQLPLLTKFPYHILW